jgi:hypothetical protein
MKIKYTFATRDTVEIEVNDGLGKEIKELDQKEYNSNKKETRRHCSADAHYEKFGFEIADKTDFVEKFLTVEFWKRIKVVCLCARIRLKNIFIQCISQRA